MNATATIARMLGPSAATVLAALLAGCMVGPDYLRPPAPQAPEYKEAQGWKVAQPRDAQPRGPWWQTFGDPDLDALEKEIDISNQTIIAAEARVRTAQALTAVARSALYPTLAADATALRTQSPASGARATALGSRSIINSYNVALNLNWELDLWGGVRRNVESSVATSQASLADLESARLSAQALLAQDYLLLRVADAQIRLYTETVAGYEKSLQLTRNQYNAGIVGRADVVQAETQLKSTQAQVVDAKLARAQLEHAIAVLAGKPPSELSIPPRETAFTFPDIPPGIPSELLERRPDIAAAERRAASANAQIGVAQAAFFPSLTLSPTGGFQSSTFASLFTLPSRYWSLGPALAQTIFDGGQRSAQKESAIATYDESVANYRAAVLNGFQEVEDNLAALHLLGQEAAIQDDAVKAAREAVTIAQNQYKAGTINYLAVVILQSAALNNERAALDILGRRMTASVTLIKALGGGWNATALAQASP